MICNMTLLKNIFKLLLVFLPAMMSCPSPSYPQSDEAPRSIEQFMALLSETGIKFEDYETTHVWSGERHSPILDTPFKRAFKTRLTWAAEGEPNFDGKYVLVSWGCGTECNHFAIIDIETGIITDGLTTRWGQTFQADSSLIIVHDPEIFFEESGENDFLPSQLYKSYYRWTGDQLLLLKTVQR